MKDRIIEFLKKENKSSAQLADEIGVQPSGISHIISGRNKPSLDFILKMLEKYKYISAEWLLFGKGPMYREPVMKDLFGGPVTPEDEIEPLAVDIPDNSGFSEKDVTPIGGKPAAQINDVIKIVWFYGDNTFEEFYPGKK